MKKILIIDDEPDVLEFMKYNLEKEGFKVFTAKASGEGIETAIRELPDLFILDVMLPDTDGIETCRLLREMPEFKQAIIVFLTARSEAYSEMAGFEAGADDYIIKPIKPNVFVSRINGLFRRYLEKKVQEPVTKAGDLIINKEEFTVTRNGDTFHLPRKEFELLLLLSSKPGKVFTRKEIFVKLWGNNLIVSERTLDVYIRMLRKKIGDDYIITLKGIGYKLQYS